jgi:hypothetical protein
MAIFYDKNKNETLLIIDNRLPSADFSGKILPYFRCKIGAVKNDLLDAGTLEKVQGVSQYWTIGQW